MTAVNDQGVDRDRYGTAKSMTDEHSLENVLQEIDLRLVKYYEEAAGRLVADPQYVFRCSSIERPIKHACEISSGEH